jgi:hypothetical protein
MYAGSTFHKYSGHVLGAHQKIDRVARRHLGRLVHSPDFPSIRLILKFEGNNGPDGIKRKSPAQNEPWHFFQPFDETDTRLIELIRGHYDLLVKALVEADSIRAAFEAAWLAHAVVDGLTPAHHFPYEEKLIELSEGQDIKERTTIAKKLIMPSDTISGLMRNNWKMWGPKGLFTTHAAFEDGFAMLIAPMRLYKAMPEPSDLAALQAESLEAWYRRQAQAIAENDFYTDFYQNGWTTAFGRKVRKELAPPIVKTVTLIWYKALQEAEQQRVIA